MASCCCELKWLTYLLHDLKVPINLPISLSCDNQAVIAIGKNPISHDRIKHVEIDCHLVRDLVDEGMIHTPYVYTSKQLADLFTKARSFKHMLPYLEKMGMKSLESFSKVWSEGGFESIAQLHSSNLHNRLITTRLHQPTLDPSSSN